MLSFQDSMNNCLSNAAKNGVTYSNRSLLVKRIIDEVAAHAVVKPRGRIVTSLVTIDYHTKGSSIIIDVHGNVNDQTLQLILTQHNKYLLNGSEHDVNSLVRRIIQLLISNNQPTKLYC